MNVEVKTRLKAVNSEKENTKSETLTESLVEAIVNGEISPGVRSPSQSWQSVIKLAEGHCAKRLCA